MSNSQKEIAAPVKSCNQKNLSQYLLTLFAFLLFLAGFLCFTVFQSLPWFVIICFDFCFAGFVLLCIVAIKKRAIPTGLLAFLPVFLFSIVFKFIKRGSNDSELYTVLALLLTVLAVSLCIIVEKKTKFDVFCAFLFALLSVALPFMLYFETLKMSLVISGIIALVGILLFVILYVTPLQNKRITTRYIVYLATFSALSVLCKIIGNSVSFIPTLKFSIVYIPWVVSGIVLGPVGGMISALIGDLLGQTILATGGSPIPLLVVSNVLMPLFPAVMFKYSKINSKAIRIFIGMAISSLVCTLGLSSLALSTLYNSSFLAMVISRLPQLIIIGINYFLIISLLPALYKAKLFNIDFYQKQNREY